MTDQRDEAKPATAEGVDQTSAPARVGLSRRELMRGASVALPTLLTLRSGSALATSSNNLIGRAATGEDPLLCLNQDHTLGPELNRPDVINLGSSPAADVIELPTSYEYRIDGTGGYTLPNAAAACEKINDANFQVNAGSGDWKSIVRDRPQSPGFCVSSQATASFGSRLRRRHITEYL